MATISTLTANLELNAAKFRKEMDAAKNRIRDLEKGTKRTSKSVSGMEHTFRGASAGIAAIDGPLGGVASRISAVNSLTRSGTGLWIGLGAAVGGASFILTRAVQTFTQIESQQLKTQALLRSTGEAAGRTAGQLEAQASEVARATLASTQDIRQAQGILLTFRSVQEENFDRSIALSQDLAAVLGTQAKDAALQLGKALEEPVVGLTSLRRAGVSFSETEKELIKDLAETGRLAEAQGLILDKLAVQVGGAGAGAAGGLAGKVDSLSQEWEEFMEELAQSGSAGVAAGAMDKLAAAVRAVREAVAPSELARLTELDHQIAISTRGLNSAIESGNQVLQDQFQANLDRYNAQRDAIIGELVAEERAQQAARQAAEDARQQAATEQQLRTQRQGEEAGAAALASLTGQLAEGTERFTLEHQKRVAIIKELQLSQEEIERAGFENIEQLRAEYIARSLEQRNQQIHEFDLQRQEATEREVEALRRETERVREENENIVNLNKERFRRIHEEALQAEGRSIELEEMRHQRELVELEAEMQRLRDRGLATAALEEQFRLARENAETVHQQRLTKIHEDEAQKRLDAQNELFDVATKAAIAGGKRELAAAIQVAKAIFDVKKREKLKEALVAGQVAIQEAWASAPFPANITAVAITTAETAATIANIQGVAHAGLDRVPREGTYLLNRDEAVLQPRANVALMDFLERQQGDAGLSSPGPVNVNFTIQAIDAEGVDKVLRDRRGTIISVVNDAMNARGKQGVA